MDKTEFYSKMNELLELPAGSINGSTALNDIAEFSAQHAE
jgi:hypothetical protein